MPRAYSTDLRERALAAYEAGDGSQARVAERYRIGARTLSAWLKAAREEARREPKPRRGGRAPVGGAGRAGRGTKRRHARRVRRPARRTRRRPAQPRGPVPGAQGARPGPEAKTLRAAEQDREEVAQARA